MRVFAKYKALAIVAAINRRVAKAMLKRDEKKNIKKMFVLQADGRAKKLSENSQNARSF